MEIYSTYCFTARFFSSFFFFDGGEGDVYRHILIFAKMDMELILR